MTPARRRKERSPVRTVREYIARINAQDLDGLAKLATARTRFVDATGGEYVLSPDAWAAFFGEFPDYRIRVDRIFSRGNRVAVFGLASGSYRGQGTTSSGAAWRFPAAWYALVRAGRVAEWRVYGDIEPMMKSAGRGRG
ncbi:MAG TPA: nuclear transport factor 2 family protein [Thermoplasmata archaeon]|nr:nuclear transport factor 2 family protein [Thermoplasmata archaeon]HYB77833.1 nuclear transport factor 2 family protein [Thermoplasmata archaeon]